MTLTESILSTDRLILRPSTPADQDALCDLFGDQEVMKMFDVGFASPRAFTYEETGHGSRTTSVLILRPGPFF